MRRTRSAGSSGDGSPQNVDAGLEMLGDASRQYPGLGAKCSLDDSTCDCQPNAIPLEMLPLCRLMLRRRQVLVGCDDERRLRLSKTLQDNPTAGASKV